jgi:branched-chain amino acid transport system ATP-binding protein
MITGKSLLTLRDVSVHYGKAIAIASINLQLQRGESVAVIGPNGTGKTTLMKAIMGLVELERGKIFFQDQVIAESNKSEFKKVKNNQSLKTYELVKLGITLCPERRQLFSESTVYQNLVLGAYTINDKEEIEKRIEWVSDLFPIIRERLHDEAGKFSGGQQQMIAIARALMRKPSILLLDEPSLGLAPFIKKTIIDAIKTINSVEKNMSMLIVEQDITMAFDVCTRGYVMENGRIKLTGSREDILKNPYVREAFLGL